MTLSELVERIDALKFEDETEVIGRLVEAPPLDAAARGEVGREAIRLVHAARTQPRGGGVVGSFLKEYSLGTGEGTALMCLAESLLRTPDNDTRDRLIAEKISMADWAKHLGQSDSFFVNASTWGLLLTGRIVELDEDTRADPAGFLRRMTAKAGEPVIRRAVMAALSIMSEQFVLGENIQSAIARADHEGMTCSFDMLGEGARTARDAERFRSLYAAAIEAVGSAARGRGPELGHGISIKLSALHPRFEAMHEARVMAELYPQLRQLALAAARHDINLTIDAEEADRQVLSLRLLQRLVEDADFGRWGGLGVVVQAYQKRAPVVLAFLAELARSSGRRLMIRLVKGAYWDTEIKRAQVAGHPDYPVYTTKAGTDASYLACARQLIADATWLYPQFATHNAHTLAAIRYMAAAAGVQVEHQRLHGMGESLYRAAEALHGPLLLRTYAPVGSHRDLLPYLVRRLLENGANSSFVHQLLDESIPAEHLVADPVARLAEGPVRHPRIPLPRDLHGRGRLNSEGADFTRATERRRFSEAIETARRVVHTSGPVIGGRLMPGRPEPVHAPACGSRLIGEVVNATPHDVNTAVRLASTAQVAWDACGGPARAVVLRRMADGITASSSELSALLVLEAGKTWFEADAETREAIDFCRYYASLAEAGFGPPEPLNGPVGETNAWGLSGRGVFACISPWNFPLAIFTGQIAAALAAGNAVVAKPAEQTPLVAAAATRIFHAAGLPRDLLALLPGTGERIGRELVNHTGISGVAFTGGVETAASIQRALAERPGPIIPLIAETGGINAMFVDTTALREQVVDDVITSAFGGAGQKCSALRMLFVPDQSADAIIDALCGALATRVIGDPIDAATDIGPVIDAGAVARLDAHVGLLRRDARVIFKAPVPAGDGTFFGPVIAEVNAPDFLTSEIFGPILHICRYRIDQLDDVARRFAANQYGLTLGIHSRLDSFIRRVRALVPAGNVYVNRSMTGAVPGVQPFGGLGLSGTGPKAGGPHSLHRFAREYSVTVNLMAQGGDPSLLGD